MRGMLKPEIEPHLERRPSVFEAATGWAWRNRVFLLVVFLPSLIVAIYLYGFASDQYVAEAHFVVRKADAQQSKGSDLGFSQVLGVGLGGGGSHSDAMSVNEYLRSNSAALELAKSIGLVALFDRDSIDPLSRLGKIDPAPEELGHYYRQQVRIDYNLDTGISSIEVAAFTRDDAKRIADALLALGEKRVNQLNERSMTDALRQSLVQMREAEQAVTATQRAVTAYRQSDRDIDPEGSAAAQLGLVKGLDASLAEMRAQLASMDGFVSRKSPQYVSLASKVRSLEAQVAAQDSRLTRGTNNIAGSLGNYQELVARQTFALKRYELAAAAYETMRHDAVKQQLYIVRVVDPILPGKSLEPERGRITLTVFFSLLVAYAIGWLIFAGIREHVV